MNLTRLIVGMIALLILTTEAVAKMKPITGKPVIDAPELLEWPYDHDTVTPNLNDPTSNTLHDFHSEISSCDLVLSSEGNYYPAVRDVWPIFLAKFKDRPLRNWFYTTSPPVALPQIDRQVVQFGNLYAQMPAASSSSHRKSNQAVGRCGTDRRAALPLYNDRGSVILIKKGNPKNIRSVWDLGRKDVRYVSPNPALEPGAFDNYANTIYNIAKNDPKPPGNMTPATINRHRLQRNKPKSIQMACWSTHPPPRCAVVHRLWQSGCRSDHAPPRAVDRDTFTNLFDIVPLGGTVTDPQPLKGTIIGTRFVVRIKGDWTPRQIEARDKLIQTLLSDDFTRILKKRGMLRPEGFVPVND